MSDKCPEARPGFYFILDEDGGRYVSKVLFEIAEKREASKIDGLNRQINSYSTLLSNQATEINHLTRQVERLRGMLKRSLHTNGHNDAYHNWTDAEIDASLTPTPITK